MRFDAIQCTSTRIDMGELFENSVSENPGSSEPLILYVTLRYGTHVAWHVKNVPYVVSVRRGGSVGRQLGRFRRGGSVGRQFGRFRHGGSVGRQLGHFRRGGSLGCEIERFERGGSLRLASNNRHASPGFSLDFGWLLIGLTRKFKNSSMCFQSHRSVFLDGIQSHRCIFLKPQFMKTQGLQSL